MANLPSQKFTLKAKDWLKGLLIAVGAVISPNIVTIISSGRLLTAEELKYTAIVALGAAITYITKNFFTDDVQVAEKTIVEARQKQIEKLQE